MNPQWGFLCINREPEAVLQFPLPGPSRSSVNFVLCIKKYIILISVNRSVFVITKCMV